jgi:signal transduction histidine kinase/ActR/RegA family two-component response regulator
MHDSASAPSTSIRTQLFGLILAGLVPVAVFGAIVLWQLWVGQRDQVRTQHEGAVAALATLVERELAGSIRRLELLASSPLLRNGSIEQFRALGQTFLALSPDWENIVLLEPTGTQVFNLAVEPGRPLAPATDRAYWRTVVDDRRPIVSDLFVGNMTGRQIVDVAVPVILGGRVRYVLAATLNMEQLEALLVSHVGKSDVAIVLDRERRIIRRSRGGPSFVGIHPVPALHAAIERAPRGWARFVAFEGDAVYTAWAPVPGEGWTVAVGIPAAPIEQTLTRSLALLGGVGLLVLLASGWLAVAAARRGAASIQAAAVAAQDLAAGRPVTLPATRIAEIDRLGDALRAAAVRLAHDGEIRRVAESERNALLARERAARAEAEAANRAKDEFLAMLGHELRNPLAAISNAASLLQRVDPAHPAARRALEIIDRQAAHQGRLLDDLLDVARVMHGKIALDRSPVDLAECARRALAALSAAGTTRTHALDASLGVAWVSGDPARLEQVVVNLVGNALKFSPPGGAVRIETLRAGADAVLRVADEGIGIDAELLPRVFDLFTQGDHTLARGTGGLGVGLTLVRRLAELHGGTAEARSAGLGRGATFVVRLPAIEAPRAPAPAPGPEGPARARRVLLVEDNDDVREMLQAALAVEGHEVQAVTDGAAALELALRFRPEVAIVDIGLPGMDGCELGVALRARFGDGVRMIALSGYGLPEDMDRSARAGFEAHLVKPVDPARLAALLRAEAGVRLRDAAA